MNRATFYAALRRDKRVFGTRLGANQVKGIEADLNEGQRRGVSLSHMAYILATDYHETGRKMMPLAENLNYSVNGLLNSFGRHRISRADAQKYGRSGNRKANQKAIANIIYGGPWGRKQLGNVKPNDGWDMRGRGKPQVTGRRNYEKFGIADNPDEALNLEKSVEIMFEGMLLGKFTGKKLSDYSTYKSMRRTVNGTDKDDKIAVYAEAFEAALRAADYSGETTSPPSPKPKPEPICAPPEKVEQVLRDEGSRTIEGADEVKTKWTERLWTLISTGGLGGLAFLQDIAPWLIALFAVMAFAGFIYWQHRKDKAARRIIDARVHDALTGKNIGRRESFEHLDENS